MENANKIKKDVLALYSLLYPENDAERQSLAKLFSKEVLKLLKYTPSEVEQVLSVENKRHPMPKNTVNVEQTIQNIDDVRSFIYTHFGDGGKCMLPKEKIEENLSDVTLSDLKYMYSLLIDVPLNGKIKKRDVLYKIFEFFDAEKRIKDMTKNL